MQIITHKEAEDMLIRGKVIIVLAYKNLLNYGVGSVVATVNSVVLEIGATKNKGKCTVYETIDAFMVESKNKKLGYDYSTEMTSLKLFSKSHIEKVKP